MCEIRDDDASVEASPQTQTQTPPAGDEQHPIQVPSQTQDPRTTRKAQLKGKNKGNRDDGTTKWKPEVIPDPESDAEALRVNGPKRWPPHPSVEDITDNGPPQPTMRKDTKAAVCIPEKLPIQPPLQNVFRKYYQILGDLEDENPPDPSQHLIWNANRQDEDIN